MIIRSDIITAEHVRQAVAYARSTGQDVYLIDGVRSFTPRRKAFGTEVFLGSANGRYASAHDPDWKAASWVAWGEVIDRLSLIDPDAEIGFYKGRDHFLTFTADEVYRRNTYRGEGIVAPWLERQAEWQRRDDLVTEALGVAPGETLVVDFAGVIDTDRIDALSDDEVDAALDALRNL